MKNLDPALLGEMMAAFAHDLRNPLSAVVTNVEFARRLLDPATADTDLIEALDDCAVACELLRRITANLDLLSRNSDALEPERIAVGEVVSELVRSYAGVCAQAGLGVDVAPIAAALDLTSDRTVLALGYENLFADAVQHAPRGSTVRLTAKIDGDALRFEVRDDGPVIPAELRALAVSAAGQTSRGRKTGSRYGRGLALLCAADAARRLGGLVEIDGDAHGSRFAFVVPRR
ncbi:MAG: HAMP domain-containing histidine kinase [Polyangiaceae bacterium]|nr:HAMP domain-containing histidine kinase [Polyangiaceae bacterium]